MDVDNIENRSKDSAVGPPTPAVRGGGMRRSWLGRLTKSGWTLVSGKPSEKDFSRTREPSAAEEFEGPSKMMNEN